ncbi:ATP-binding protein [Aureibacter tunicatorum]|uniref:ATP-binding protein n=1 Tax=Aureibacter tunicatorum TaxID=866807 RepID=A0AAE3XQB6_9BACT|nr:ATP-binding protein [Aureibacter tunicatorum]MDR6239419.1 hypothetical protein [Aureibacter tunicatorum]BDD04658.1 ATP-binding protein [Aureibacter tunicatorum]
MKSHLNRLIFINSASVPYAEVALDGNIHFVGSNGFGKTTVLRSILFFYNPTSDKRALGIREDQKSFSNYYFEHENSYILYEIAKENFKFHIAVYKKGGKLQFRFVNSEFDKNLYIKEDYTARSHDELWKYMDNQLVSYTDELVRYADLRKIIYGSSNNKKYFQYSLFPSEDGAFKRNNANIPQLISNIFRTSKLDSRHIKKSIIEAVYEEDVKPIDLTTIERQLAKFRNDYKDLEAFENNQELANEIIKLSESSKDLDKSMKENANLLGLGIQNVSKKLGELEVKLDTNKVKINDIEKNQAEQLSIHDQRKEDLNGQKAVLLRDLNEIKRLREHYASSNISEVIKRVDQKPSLKIEIEQLTKDISDFKGTHKNANKLFETKIEEAKSNFSKVENEFLNKTKELEDKYREIAEAKKNKFRDELDQKHLSIQEEIKELDEELVLLKEEIVEVEYHAKDGLKSHPLSIKERNLKQQLLTLKNQSQDLESLIKNIKKDLSLLKEKLELKLKSHENEFVYKLKSLQNEINLNNERLQECDKKLNQFDGSLLEYLQNNDANWTENIGKVIKDELLYQPNIIIDKSRDSSETIFGYKFDLSKLATAKNSYKDLLHNQEKIQTKISSSKRDFSRLQEEKETKNDEIKREFEAESKKLKSELDQFEYKFTQLEFELKECELEHEETSAKFLEIRNQKADENNSKLNYLNEKFNLVTSNKNRKLLEFSVKKDLIRDENTKIEQIVKSEKETSLLPVNQNFEEYKKQFNADFLKLEELKSSSLKKSGIDPSLIREKENRLSQLNSLLSQIEGKEEKLVEQYLYDQDRILSKGDEIEEKYDFIIQELDKEKKSFASVNSEYLSSIDQLKENQYQWHTEKIDLENVLKEDIDTFRNLSHSPYHKFKSRIDTPKAINENSNINVKALINSLNSDYSHYNLNLSTLQKRMNKFTGLFSPNNFLNFSSSRQMESDLDFFRFVENKLKPFVESKSIETARSQIEQLHGELINDIALEIKDFSSKSTELEETISQINSDFTQTNFVGVVKSIELDYRPKDIGVVSVLKKIKSFTEQHNIGNQFDFFKENDNNKINQKSVKLLSELKNAIDKEGKFVISLEDTFDIWFKVAENNNNTGWVEKLSNVGSEGTDVLVKSMIYITLLNVFKLNAFKTNDNYQLHCMIDEVGKLSDRYLRELIEFTNNKNIKLIFGSPNENDPLIYQHVYKLHRENDQIMIVELIGESI